MRKTKMYFKTLPKDIQTAIMKLTKDEEFQRRFRTDKILDDIDEMKENLDEEYQSFLALMNKKIKLKDREVFLLTPAMWTFLYICQSPFTDSSKIPSTSDVDIFMYILDNGLEEMDTVELFMKSIDYCKRSEIDLNTAVDIILLSIKIAFRPLKLFPRMGGNNSKPIYDCDWITCLISKVHAVTGYSPDYIMKELSLTSACYYFAQHRRLLGDDTIYKRTDDEILLLQDDRCCELICDRLIELNVFPAEEKAKWKKEMMTLPNNK